MTQEEIKPHDHPDFVGGWVWRDLEMRWIEQRIAEAVAAEREACAKECENHKVGLSSYFEIDERIQECADAIRARGETK